MSCRRLRSSIQDKKCSHILQANMESQLRNRFNAIIRASNVDRFMQMHICMHMGEGNTSRYQRLCRSSQDPNSHVYRLTEPIVRVEGEKI